MKRVFKSKFFSVGLVLALIGLGLRALYLWQYSSSPLFITPVGPDVEEYHDWALEIISGGLLWNRVHIHAPLYPALLAGLYKIFVFNMLYVRATQLLLGMGGFIFCYRMVKIWAFKRQSLVPEIFLGLALLYPMLIFYQAELVSESLQLPLLCVTLGLLYLGEGLLRRKKSGTACGLTAIAGAGFAAGLAALAHPMTLLFIVAETVFLLVFRRPKKKLAAAVPKAALFALLALSVIVPVCVRNSLLEGRFVLIQKNSGFNFYLGNNPAATGGCYLRPGRFWNQTHTRNRAEAKKQGIAPDRLFVRKALRFMVENPGRELGLLFTKAFNVWNIREQPAGADMEPLLFYTPLQSCSRYSFLLLGTLAMAGLILLFIIPGPIPAYRHFLLLLFSFWAAQIITVTSGRYRLAMYPAFFMLAAFAVDACLRRCKNKALALKTIAAVLVGAAVALLPLTQHNPQQEQAEAASLLGEAFYHQGKYADAKRFLTSGVKLLNDPARPLNLLGSIAMKQKDDERAEKYFTQAVDAAPDEPEGYMNLAILASKKQRFKRADELFAAAFKRGGDKPDLLYNYAYYLQRRKRLSAAKKYYLKCLEVAPGDRRALNALGVLSFRIGKFNDAARYFTKALAIEPRDLRLRLNLAVAQIKSGQLNAARKNLEFLLDAEPGNKPANRLLQEINRNN